MAIRLGLMVVGCLLTGLTMAQALLWQSEPALDIGWVNDGDIAEVRISPNGRYVAFISSANNLVANDTRGEDLFIKDLVSGDIQRVNTTSAGAQMVGDASTANLELTIFSAPSNNGNFVAFAARASNFPDYADEDTSVLYVKNLNTGALTTASKDAMGNLVDVVTLYSGIELTADGLYLAFASATDITGGNPDVDQFVYRKNRQTGNYALMSLDPLGQPFGKASLADMSSDGRYLAMYGTLADITRNPEDETSFEDLWLRDQSFATTVQANVQPGGMPSSGFASSAPYNASVSDNGQVAYCSFADDLINNDTNGEFDLFVFNGVSNARHSVDPAGQQLDDFDCGFNKVELDADASHVAFVNNDGGVTSTPGNGKRQLYLRNIGTLTTQMITKSLSDGPASDATEWFSVSADAQTVVFSTAATDLTTDPIPAVYAALYRFETSAQTLAPVEIATFSSPGLVGGVTLGTPVVSNDMQWFLFSTAAPNVINPADYDGTDDLILLDRDTQARLRVATEVGSYDMSYDGRYIVFTSERFHPTTSIDLGEENVFLYDRVSDQYTQIAMGSEPKVNIEGNVVFVSEENLLVPGDTNDFLDVFFFTRQSSTISLVSASAPGIPAPLSFYQAPDIAGAGAATWVSFTATGDFGATPSSTSSFEVFIKNWPNGAIQRISEDTNGDPSNSLYVAGGTWSDDTQSLVFISDATNLSPAGNPLGLRQVYLYDRNTSALSLISQDTGGNASLAGNFGASQASVSPQGRYVGFTSDAWDIVDDDDDETSDVFLYDRDTDTMTLISQSVNGPNQDEGLAGHVVVDNSVSPELVAVAMRAGGKLTERDPAPKDAEAFLYQSGGPGATISMQVDGLGMVAGNLGYSCDATCEDTYALGTVLNLVAIPDAGESFLGWSGDVCSGTELTCEVLMNQPRDIQALFSESVPNDVIFTNGFGD